MQRMHKIGPALLILACVSLAYASLQNSDTIDQRQNTLNIQNELHIYDQPATVWIAAGPRPTDRVLAYLLRSLLTQHIGYKDVKLFNATYGYHEWVNAIARNSSVTLANYLNQPMIHLGLTEDVEGNEQYFNSSSVLSVGELGPRLRRGWFVRSATAQRVAAKFGRSPEHWKFFTNATLASAFVAKEKQINMSTIIPQGTWGDGKGRRWCEPPQCDETGQFIPKWCLNEVKCATVVAAFPHESFEILKNQIVELKLYVKAAWFGTDFGTVLKQLDDLIFFDYSISPLTYEGDGVTGTSQTTEILFPSCNTLDEPKGCIRQSVKMRKVIWQPLKTNARPIYRLIQNIKLTGAEYSALMEPLRDMEYNEQDFQKVGGLICSERWEDCSERWMKDVDVYPALFVLAIVKNNERYLQNITLFALSRVNQLNLIPHFYMKQRVIYGNCSKATLNDYRKSVNGVYKDDQIIAVVSPECKSTMNLVEQAQINRHAVITYQADIATVDNQDEQEYFFRVAPDTSIISEGYMKLFRYFHWHTFVHLYDKASVSEVWNFKMTGEARENNLDVQPVSLTNEVNLRTTLETVRNLSRNIIIADCQLELAIRTMCTAHDLEMTWRKGYVWLLPSWLPKNWFNVSDEDLPENCTVANFLDSINYSFAYRFKEIEDDNFKIDAGFKTVAEWKQNINYHDNVHAYVGYAYDSIWTLATSLKNLNSTSMISSLQDTSLNMTYMNDWANIIQTNTFKGVTGTIQFRKNARQTSHIFLHQYVNGSYEEVGNFTLNQAPPVAKSILFNGELKFAKDDGSLTVRDVKWPDGKPPTDGYRRRIDHNTDTNKCPEPINHVAEFFNGISCSFAMAITVCMIVLTSVITLGSIGGGCVYRVYKRKVKKIEQKKSIPLSSLTDYELPENTVRIYRSLGEGAFGKVYLGEYLHKEGCGMAVAVKAAKDPKNLNAKLELLSEAEVMKLFEHVNILRLIGVITQGDKCQIVTEFMMFGNLRSYLQDRRHLAMKGEIGPAHLTRMALDISRGLSYLASLNYVHGDLACRNCLVHETLTIKIADFGFCKNLVDSDYYRVVRSGPMPVRWMSPELLSTGAYHVQSDIWSFGVVLYEIVTFGAYPYHDLDDDKVQNYIRSGGFPTLPQKISSKLEALFLRIWTLNKHDRPTALELFEILAADAELVHPSLEESPATLDYINCETQGRQSRGSSAGISWANIRRARSPTGSAHNTPQRIRFNAATNRAKIDIV